MDDSAGRVDQAATRIGSVLDERWALDSLLGIGGTAAVYAARAGDARVAIKVLHPELTRSQRALDRFRREGDALRAATHAAVPCVRGEGTTVDGCPYLVMDLLLGETLEARRRRFGGKLAAAEVVQIALDVLDVLDVVHERGLLHRDVKPSNVLWLDDGSIRLIDFGIAKTLLEDEQIALTRTGALPGSLAFMSPEHALGVPSELDARSDLWSLGATMFLLLSGRPVHESQTEVEALALAASRRARSLGSVVSGLPPGLIAVVDRALAFDRRKRFADAAEMSRAMRALSATRVRNTYDWSRGRWFLAATALLAVGGVSAWSAKSAEVAGRGPRMAVSSPATTVSAPRDVPSAGPEVAVEPEVAAESTAPAPVLAAEGARPSRPSRVAHHVAPAGQVADGPAPSSSVSPAPPRCDPPFLIDPETGTRRVKPGC